MPRIFGCGLDLKGHIHLCGARISHIELNLATGKGADHTYGILLVLTVLFAIVSCPGPRLSIGCFFLVGQFGARGAQMETHTASDSTLL